MVGLQLRTNELDVIELPALVSAWAHCTFSISLGFQLWSKNALGSFPVHCGPMMAISCLPFPMVRVPGAAKTLVPASNIDIR
jgi:hypothetical protein